MSKCFKFSSAGADADIESDTNQECFICYGDGTSDYDKNVEVFNCSWSYPMVTLSEAYNCNCKTMLAHNRCLMRCVSCPSCRKHVRPNLYVKSRWDYWLYYMFEFIKRNIQYFEDVKLSIAVVISFACYVYIICDILIADRSSMIMVMTATIGSIFNVLLLIVVILNDYMSKYWLYSSKKKSYWTLM